jgi:hypothetical protein
MERPSAAHRIAADFPPANMPLYEVYRLDLRSRRMTSGRTLATRWSPSVPVRAIVARLVRRRRRSSRDWEPLPPRFSFNAPGVPELATG